MWLLIFVIALDISGSLFAVGGWCFARASLVFACAVLAGYAVGALVDGGRWMLIVVVVVTSFWQKLPGFCMLRNCSFHLRKGANPSDPIKSLEGYSQNALIAFLEPTARVQQRSKKGSVGGIWFSA